MKSLELIYEKSEVMINDIKTKIYQEVDKLILSKWQEGILIKIGQINTIQVDSDLKLHYSIEYQEIEDENYLKEQERLMVGV